MLYICDYNLRIVSYVWLIRKSGTNPHYALGVQMVKIGHRRVGAPCRMPRRIRKKGLELPTWTRIRKEITPPLFLKILKDKGGGDEFRNNAEIKLP